MKKYSIIVLLFLVGSLSAQQITVNEDGALVSFYFIDDKVKGTFGGFQFTGSVDLNDLTNSKISGSVVTKTIDTNNWLRSRHLRARKFFNAKEYPIVTFESSSISGVKEGFQVVGTLQIKGIKKEVIWNFSNNDRKLTGTATLNTRDFDISIHDKKERNKVRATITLPYQ